MGRRVRGIPGRSANPTPTLQTPPYRRVHKPPIPVLGFHGHARPRPNVGGVLSDPWSSVVFGHFSGTQLFGEGTRSSISRTRTPTPPRLPTQNGPRTVLLPRRDLGPLRPDLLETEDPTDPGPRNMVETPRQERLRLTGDYLSLGTPDPTPESNGTLLDPEDSGPGLSSGKDGPVESGSPRFFKFT